ncbi:hypothetical protein JTE90_013944 [Oedothorax gibbosus]|uniref:Uncharacterized protein n=1 Tax=Oedothorax gibbosus TaxID=931172 RepID=A0AAV6UCM6_9ARAC|nr:hypothetical protein JTE90_013944 [Oedothorax gibbosus]
MRPIPTRGSLIACGGNAVAAMSMGRPESNEMCWRNISKQENIDILYYLQSALDTATNCSQKGTSKSTLYHIQQRHRKFNSNLTFVSPSGGSSWTLPSVTLLQDYPVQSLNCSSPSGPREFEDRIYGHWS